MAGPDSFRVKVAHMDKLKRRLIMGWKRDWQLYLFMLLPVVFILIFHYYPMLGLQLAFRKYTAKGGMWGSKWVGLDNIVKFLNSYQFERVVANTVILSLYGLACAMVIPVCFALLLNAIERARFKKICQTIVNLPHFISIVVLVGIVNQFFNNRTGLYGNLVLNLTGSYPPDIFGNLSAFRHLYIWSGVWQNFGWNSIIYIATLSGVDMQLHEAAQIDGASRVQRIWHVDLPYLKPTIITLFILHMGNVMSVGFEKAYLMQNPLNLAHSELISTYVYRIGLSGTMKTDFSYATAIGLFNSVVNLILVMTANMISKKLSDTSLF